MRQLNTLRSFAAATSMVAAACAPAARTTAPTPVPIAVPGPIARPAPTVMKAPLPPANPRLPAVPQVNGPLAITVIYPKPGEAIAARDSNFIFGSVGNGDAALSINGVLTPVWPNGSFMGWLKVPPIDAPRYDLVAVMGTDTVRLAYPVRVPSPVTASATAGRADTLVRFSSPTFALLRPPATTAAASDTDRVVFGRPERGGTYKWFLFPNTVVKVNGLTGTYAQVQLDQGQTIWIERNSLALQDSAFAPTAINVASARTVSAPGWLDLIIPSSAPPAYLIEQSDNAITLTLYGAGQSSASPVVAATDPYVSSVTVAKSGDRLVYTLGLGSAPFGYLALWENGEMTLRVRRPPRTNAASPLRGLTIAVDPGHPPVGATGPTGLYEAVPTLEVGFRVRDMLAARGANVVMTRTDERPVDLGLRPIIARRINAHALVSIHFNALPDGQNPFTSNGTSTYYFQPHSKRFAQLVQQELLIEMGLRDIGFRYGNLALVRPTWMPSVLAEGAFIMMPDQEAAIKTPQYQDAYARAIVKGLERYFAGMAGSL